MDKQTWFASEYLAGRLDGLLSQAYVKDGRWMIYESQTLEYKINDFFKRDFPEKEKGQKPK